MAPLQDIAAWAAYLPPESATARSMDEHWQRTPEIDLLREGVYRLDVLAWQERRINGTKSEPFPERLALPWDVKPEPTNDAHEWHDLPDSLADPRLLAAMGLPT